MNPLRSLAVPLILLAALIVPPHGSVRAQSALPIVESFDELPGPLPAGWKNESFGDVSVSFAAETRKAKEGKGCWRVQVGAWEGGAARIARPGLPLHAGSTYSVEVWLRGSGVEAPVEVSLRKGGAPQTAYLAGRFAVGPEWRRCVLTGKCATEDPNGVLALSLAGSGTLWIDALRLGEGDPISSPEGAPPTASAPVKGNLLYNSGFELGTAGWAGAETAKLVSAGAADGRQFLRWEPGSPPLEPRPFPAKPNQQYTFSASVRSNDPGTSVEMAVVERGGGFRTTRAFPLSSAWKRVSFTATLPCREYARYYLALRSTTRAAIDVDAVQVEEGDLTDYQPAAPMEISTGLSRERLFPAPNEMVTLPIHFQAREKTGQGCALRYRLEGFHGETRAFGTAVVPSGMERGEVPIHVRLPIVGTVRAVVDGIVDEQPVSHDEAVLTVLQGTESAREGKGAALFPAPGYHSWQGAEEQSRAAAVAFARMLIQERSTGVRAPLTYPDPREAETTAGYASTFSQNNSLLDYDGSGKPTLPALAVCAAALSGAAPAGRVETEAYRAYVFAREGETVAALWAPGAVSEPRELEVNLPPRQCLATDLMGNRAGFRTRNGKVVLVLGCEPAYLQVRDLAPEAVLAALKAGKLAVPAPARKKATAVEPAAAPGR